VWFGLFRQKTNSNQEETMAGLARTDLTASQKVTVSALALTGKGRYGAISQLSEDFGLSRPTVYAAGAEAGAVLERHFEALESRVGEVMVRVDEAQIRRTIVALRCRAANSIRAIEDLLPILYPGVKLSYGWIQQVCVEAERRAAEFNAKADLSGIKAGALDEMFSQGDPVLAGVDLDTGYLFSLSLRDSRRAKDWAEVLQSAKAQGLSFEVVVKDAAQGIAAGVREVFPDVEQRDDCFHAHYQMGKALRVLETRAYGVIAREQEVLDELETVRRTGRGDRRKLTAKLGAVRRKCHQAIEKYDRFEEAVRDAQEAMEYIDLNNAEFSDPDKMKQQIVGAGERMMALDNERCRKVGRYVINRADGLVLYMRELVSNLEALYPRFGEKQVRLAAHLWRLFRELKNHRWPWDRDADEQLFVRTFHRLRDLAGDETNAVLEATNHLVERRHRASSAIEGFNAALRPYLYVHKGVTSGFLELFRAYYNLRTRRWGRHKGTSAHQLLGGEPLGDWLSVLGYPPSRCVS
jgi:hypothetical protein